MNKFPIFCLEPYPHDTSLCICKHFKIQKSQKPETEPATLISNRDALSVNTRQRTGNSRRSSSALNVSFTNPHELHQPQATSMGSGRQLELRFRIPVKGGVAKASSWSSFRWEEPNVLSKSTFLGWQSGETTCLSSSSDGLLGLVRISSFGLDCCECQSQVGLYPGVDFNVNSLV